MAVRFKEQLWDAGDVIKPIEECEMRDFPALSSD
jgi:hypothetical protein